MGKSNKLKRLEKAKVKLKAKKLPKGQNITDTSFKTRKIVIPEQLKSVSEGELHTKKKLNVKELLTHLRHHNMTVRQDGLSGLKELITLYTDEVIRLHLPEVIDGVAQLVLDLETDVRRNALKLIDTVLLKVTSEQIVPLFDVLQCYMTCAMTHIKPSIQDDSLLLLDSLLPVCPHLIALKADKILPSFLDMVSHLRNESKPDRTLIVNLNNKMTSVRWRIKVLSRLNKFFHAVVSEKKKKSMSYSHNVGCKTVKWEEDTPIYAAEHMSFNSKVCRMPQILCPSLGIAESEANECEMLKQYIQGLVPLLFETWLEAAPEEKNMEANILSDESALLLQCILGTIQRLWEFLECWESEAKINALTTWFKLQYEKDLIKHFLPGFPYTLLEHSKSSRGTNQKQRKQAKTEQLLLQDNVVVSSQCVQQNLSLCYLLTCIHDGGNTSVGQQVTSYVQKCLNSWTSEILLPQLDLVLRALLIKHSCTWANVINILKCVVKCHQCSTDEKFRQTLFHLLCDIILEPNSNKQFRCPEFEEWISKLPRMLCEPSISKKAVDTLIRLACQNNNMFLENLYSDFESIIGNLTHIEVQGVSDPVEGVKAMIDILYRAGEMDSAVFDYLVQKFSDTSAQKEIVSYIEDIRTLRDVMCI